MKEEIKRYIKRHLRAHTDTEIDLKDLTESAHNAYVGSSYRVDSFRNDGTYFDNKGNSVLYIIHMGDIYTGVVKTFEELLLFFEAEDIFEKDLKEVEQC